MPTTTTDNPARTFAERILTEMKGMRADLDSLTTEVSILKDCAALLLQPLDQKDTDSPLKGMMRLMNLMVAGTELTHKSLEALHSALFDRNMTPALRLAIED